MAPKKKSATNQAAGKQPAVKKPASQSSATNSLASKQSPPKKDVPKKAASKKTSPDKATPKTAPPRKAAPKKAPPEQAAPIRAVTHYATNNNNLPENTATRDAIPKEARPKQQPQSISNGTKTSAPKEYHPRDYLTLQEQIEIDNQFAATLKGVDVLLFWTGVKLEYVQQWAKLWDLKTLTTAMGPLMDRGNSQSPKARKDHEQYSKYMKGASGRFAQYARQHCRVLVLTNPPPNIYSSRDDNTYQTLEEPILKGYFGGPTVRRIDYVHPTVEGAAHITYQMWPQDESMQWAIAFGGSPIEKWENVNWSYQSLSDLSKVDRKPLRESGLSATAASQVTYQRSSLPDKRVAFKHSAELNDLPVLLVNYKDTGDALNDHGRPTTGIDIKCHESQILATGSGTGQLASNCSRIEIHIHDPVEKELDFHENRYPGTTPYSSTLASSFPTYSMPIPPKLMLVIDISDIAVRGAKSIEADELGMCQTFLSLCIRRILGLGIWWKLRWMDMWEKIKW